MGLLVASAMSTAVGLALVVESPEHVCHAVGLVDPVPAGENPSVAWVYGPDVAWMAAFQTEQGPVAAMLRPHVNNYGRLSFATESRTAVRAMPPNLRPTWLANGIMDRIQSSPTEPPARIPVVGWMPRPWVAVTQTAEQLGDIAAGLPLEELPRSLLSAAAALSIGHWDKERLHRLREPGAASRALALQQDPAEYVREAVARQLLLGQGYAVDCTFMAATWLRSLRRHVTPANGVGIFWELRAGAGLRYWEAATGTFAFPLTHHRNFVLELTQDGVRINLHR